MLNGFCCRYSDCMTKLLIVLGLLAVIPFSFASAASTKHKKKRHVTLKFAKPAPKASVAKAPAAKTSAAKSNSQKVSSKIEPIRIDGQKRGVAGDNSKLPKAFGDATIEEAPPAQVDNSQKRFPANKY